MYILAYTLQTKTPTKTILRDHWEAHDRLRDANKAKRDLLNGNFAHQVWSASVCRVVNSTDY